MTRENGSGKRQLFIILQLTYFTKFPKMHDYVNILGLSQGLERGLCR